MKENKRTETKPSLRYKTLLWAEEEFRSLRDFHLWTVEVEVLLAACVGLQLPPQFCADVAELDTGESPQGQQGSGRRWGWWSFLSRWLLPGDHPTAVWVWVLRLLEDVVIELVELWLDELPVFLLLLPGRDPQRPPPQGGTDQSTWASSQIKHSTL